MNELLSGRPDSEPITFRDLALHRGAKEDEDGAMNGAEFDRVGLSIMGGCAVCGATLAAYNGYPSKSGYWNCRRCLCGSGWTDAAEADRDIFGESGSPDWEES